MTWREEPIGKQHDRAGFDCGDPDLNRYLVQHARQNHLRGGSKTFVATPDDKRVWGYYSLAPASIDFDRTPEVMRRGLARYDVPGFRLGRLAVDRSLQGQGLGGKLLMAAGRRCLRASAEVGGVAIVIDAKNDGVAKWYERFGAIRLYDAPLTLVLSLDLIADALDE